MARKLASIQEVKAVHPIEGADRIEMAQVLGWECVVNKGTLKPGDLAVYFEIDSFLPVKPEFEFLRASSFRKSELLGEGFKLKTMKFRGQVSQGLLLPLETFECLKGANLGDDVTDLLGVVKWEIPEATSSGGTIIGELPHSIPKTDETRVQSNPDLISEFTGLEYYISTKMDGSSHSISLDSEGFHVTGHNYEYKDDGTSGFYEKIVKPLDLENKVKTYCDAHSIDELVLQGELCAPGIQKNRLKLQKPAWYVFTVRINGKRVCLKTLQDVCSDLGVETVPIEEVGVDLPSKYPTVESLLERADGEYPNGGKKEGIVIRPTEPVFSKLISASLSMKVVNNKYLLKNED